MLNLILIVALIGVYKGLDILEKQDNRIRA